MRMTSQILVLAIAATVSVSAQSTRHPYAVEAPIKEPRMLLEGIISTPYDDLNATFSRDGKTVYFCRWVGGRVGVMMQSHFKNGEWSKPVFMPFSGMYEDYDPALSADGNRLFFCSNRPIPGQEQKHFDIYVVQKDAAGNWGEPRNLGAPVNTPANEFYPSVSDDGTLMFSSNRPGGKGQYDIYMASWRDGTYQEPQNLGDAINLPTGEIDNYLAPDKSYILFAGYGRQDSKGNGDIYISWYKDGAWTTAKNVGPKVNTPYREYCPVVSPDGRYFFWTSYRSVFDTPPTQPYTFDTFMKLLGGPANGQGNVWQIDLTELER
jgi:hypothetical protein